jgi:putative MATE family efflux protein
MLQKPIVSARPIWRSYLNILLPMMLTNVLQTASGAIDGIYLGQLLGVNAVAAVSAFFPVVFLLLAVVIGLSSGTTVLIAQAWGAGDRQKVRTIAGTALAMMTVAGVAISLGGGLFAPQIIRALGTPVAVQPEALRYARLFMLGMPIIFALWLVTSMSRGVGDAVTPLKALIIAAAMSLVCTPALILGWGILPKFGVVSAAISNLAAYLVALLWLARHWRRTGHPLAPSSLRLLHIDPGFALAILQIGVPAAFQMLAMAVAEIALIKLINRYGMGATAAYGAINQVMSWVQLPVMSLGITGSILASHAIGSGRPERVGTIVRTGLYLNTLTTGGFIVLAYILARPIIGLFIVDGGVAVTAIGLLRTVLWSLIALGGASVLTGVMRSDGTVLGPTALSVFAILGIEIPAAYLFEAHFGLPGIWAAYATTFVAMLILQTVFFRFVWRRRARRRLV